MTKKDSSNNRAGRFPAGKGERVSPGPVRRLLALMVGCLVVSCTTPSPEMTDESPRATLIVARTGDHSVLSWQSRVGEMYTVLYADGSRVGVEWKPLQGAQRIHGNGQEIRLTDRMPPGVIRYYRLMVVPAESRPVRSGRR